MAPNSSNTTTSSWYSYLSMSRGTTMYTITTIIIATLLILVYNLYMLPKEEQSLFFEATHNPKHLILGHKHECHWDATNHQDIVLFNIHTKLGVNYDAGHWFHMAENIMVQHSLLRRVHGLTNATKVYYNFDQEGFTNELNGITRLIVYLGTIAPLAKTESIHFIANPHLFRYTDAHVGDSLHIPTADLNKHDQAVSMSMLDSPTAIRFVKPSSNVPTLTGHHQCVRYAGTIGGRWPTPQRGSWFTQDGDIESFRQKIRDACPPDNEMLKKYQKKKDFKLVIYQRDLSRKLANQEESLAFLKARLPESKWDVQVLMHSKSRSPCELAHILQDADVLLTPHGFQSMLLLFLPRPSLLFEVFPYRYYKRGYGPFGKEYGIVHGGVMSPATLWHTEFFLQYVTTSYCMSSKFCRGYARNQDVVLTVNGANRLLAMIHEHVVSMKKVAMDSQGVLTLDGSSSEYQVVQVGATRFTSREALYSGSK